MPESSSQGQNLDFRTRRGADFVRNLTLTDGVNPVDVTGAQVVGRIFATGQPDVTWAYSVAGNVITVRVPAGKTLAMVQDWRYTLGYKLGGNTKALLFGAFTVAQEPL